MPIYPGAVKWLVPQGDPGNSKCQPHINVAGVILHTNASNSTIERLHSLYLDPGYNGGEAHFQLETAPPHGNGRLAQYVDTNIRADNNYRANSFRRADGSLWGYISIETADLGQPYTKSWSDLGERRQLEDLLVWLCLTHKIPTIRCPNPFGNGIGYHAMWGYNYYGPGDGAYGHYTDSSGRNLPITNPWTLTAGKICPGPGPGVPGGKIGEFPDLLHAVAVRVQAALHPPPPPPPVPPKGKTMPYIINVADSGALHGNWLVENGVYEKIPDNLTTRWKAAGAGIMPMSTAEADAFFAKHHLLGQ